MTPGQQIARQGVEGLDRFHFWKRQQKRLAAGHAALDQLAAGREEPLASTARVLQAMSRAVAQDPDCDQALCRAGLEKIATTALEQAASPTSYVAAVALAAANGLESAEQAALTTLSPETSLEKGLLATGLEPHEKLQLLAEPGQLWTSLPDADVVKLGCAQLQADPRPGARWLTAQSSPQALRAGLQANLEHPLEVARAVHAASPLKLNELTGLGWDSWLTAQLTEPQQERWIGALLSARDPLGAAVKLAGDSELAIPSHAQACSDVLGQRPEMSQGLQLLRELSQKCAVPPEAAREAERSYLAGSATSSPADLAALVEEHAQPGLLRAELLQSYPSLAAIPDTAEGAFALSAALDGLRGGNPTLLAVNRLARAQDKLAVLAVSQNPLASRLARSEQGTPWTRVRAATAALSEPNSVLKGGVKALETCQEPAQEHAVASVVSALLEETWGDSPALAQYLQRLEHGDRAQGLKDLALLEEQGVLQLVAGRPTGSIEETRDGVVVGGVVLPKRD